MKKHIATYRTVTLITVAALVSSAFAPLSSLCGMDMSKPLSEMPPPPCHDLGTSNEVSDEHHSMVLDWKSSRGADDASSSAETPICCVVRVPVAPKTEKVAHPPVIQVVEFVAGEVVASPKDIPASLAPEADESPPCVSTISLHLLLGCFLS